MNPRRRRVRRLVRRDRKRAARLGDWIRDQWRKMRADEGGGGVVQ